MDCRGTLVRYPTGASDLFPLHCFLTGSRPTPIHIQDLGVSLGMRRRGSEADHCPHPVPFVPRSQTWSLLFKFSNLNCRNFSSPLHVTCPAHLLHHDLNALIIFREVRKLCRITVACRTNLDGSNTGIPGYIPIRNVDVCQRSWRVCILAQHSLKSLTPSVSMHIGVEKRLMDVHEIWYLRMLKAEFTSLLSFGYNGTDIMATMHEGHCIRGVFKKRSNFLNSAPTTRERALRLQSAPSVTF